MSKRSFPNPERVIEYAKYGRQYITPQEKAKQIVEQVLSRMFCGCGDIKAAENAFLEVLDLFKQSENGYFYVNLSVSNEFVQRHGEGLTTLILYWLSEFGIAEHGGSVGGSWLTPLGEVVREEMLTKP